MASPCTMGIFLKWGFSKTNNTLLFGVCVCAYASWAYRNCHYRLSSTKVEQVQNIVFSRYRFRRGSMMYTWLIITLIEEPGKKFNCTCKALLHKYFSQWTALCMHSKNYVPNSHVQTQTHGDTTCCICNCYAVENVVVCVVFRFYKTSKRISVGSRYSCWSEFSFYKPRIG
jgi:hypothetical protein